MPRQFRRKGTQSMPPAVSLETAVRSHLPLHNTDQAIFDQRELLVRLILVLEDGLNDEDIRRLLPGWEVSHGV